MRRVTAPASASRPSNAIEGSELAVAGSSVETGAGATGSAGAAAGIGSEVVVAAGAVVTGASATTAEPPWISSAIARFSLSRWKLMRTREPTARS